MKIEVRCKNINNKKHLEFIIQGDNKTGYKVQEDSGDWVNPYFADLCFSDYPEIIREVMKAGTSILWLENGEVCYMATESYHISCEAVED